MVTKTKRTASKTAAPTKRSTARATKAAAAPRAAPAAEAVPAKKPGAGAKPNLLRAGLKALGNVRSDVAEQQSRVFEAILGVDPRARWSPRATRDAAAKAANEAFGLRKFEAVFDQRVASALERMGLPAIETLRSLTDEVAALKAELQSLKAARRKR